MKLDSSVGCFIILLSVLGGFLIADPLLTASNIANLFQEERFFREVRLFAWVVTALFTSIFLLFGFRTLLYFALRTVSSLQTVAVKPAPPITITFIICGTICMLAVIWMEYLALTSASSLPTFATMNSQLNSQMNHGNVVFQASVANGSGVRVFAHLFAGLVFLAGSSLITLGAWGSIPNPSGPVTYPMPPAP
jgi:uncharacterized membrane protein YjgN (DUF898 family)